MLHRLRYSGTFAVPDEHYTACGEMIAILQNEGFALTEIQTSGNHSQHDCISDFYQKYASFPDFANRVYDDFANADTYFSEVDWSHTRFNLQNDAAGISLRFGIVENNKKDRPFISIVPPVYCGFFFEPMGSKTDDDIAAYCDELTEKMAEWCTFEKR